MGNVTNRCQNHYIEIFNTSHVLHYAPVYRIYLGEDSKKLPYNYHILVSFKELFFKPTFSDYTYHELKDTKIHKYFKCSKCGAVLLDMNAIDMIYLYHTLSGFEGVLDYITSLQKFNIKQI